mmetsp:Transcript_32632/g.107909  ORF Transcript_32632/g.107909 Transcript_32632/m.107909 type:complete len:261 (-) Transcript_32632:113-895(-)
MARPAIAAYRTGRKRIVCWRSPSRRGSCTPTAAAMWSTLGASLALMRQHWRLRGALGQRRAPASPAAILLLRLRLRLLLLLLMLLPLLPRRLQRHRRLHTPGLKSSSSSATGRRRASSATLPRRTAFSSSCVRWACPRRRCRANQLPRSSAASRPRRAALAARDRSRRPPRRPCQPRPPLLLRTFSRASLALAPPAPRPAPAAGLPKEGGRQRVASRLVRARAKRVMGQVSHLRSESSPAAPQSARRSRRSARRRRWSPW